MREAYPPLDWRLGLGLAGLSVATVATLMTAPTVAFVPVLSAAVALALVKLPLHYPVAAWALLMLVVDSPATRPAAGLWDPPLLGLGKLLFENLHKLTGIDALRMSLMEVFLVVLLGLALFRGAADQRVGTQVGTPIARPLTRALVLALLGVLLTEAWGLARGGDFRNSLWQVRQLLTLPLLGLLLLAAFDTPEKMRALTRIAVAAAVFKTLQGLYFREVICRPMNFRPPYVASHSDTMLFVGVFVLVATYWHERATRLSRRLLFLVGPLMAVAVYINGRRLAYVSLAAAAAVIFLLSPRTPLKRFTARLGLALAPVLSLYLAVGWNQSGGIFRPAQLVKSVVSSDADRSSQTRDIENYNLVMTLKENPLLGTGFGHEYREVSQADDISTVFPQYRYIPHNSLLGLAAFAGVVGFWLFWLPVVVATFLAARAYPRARSPEDRTTALVCLSTFMTYAIQAYGDMGLQSDLGALLLAAALAASGRLAAAVGAWPTMPRREEEGIRPE